MPIRGRAIRDMVMALEGTCDSATAYQKKHDLFPLSEDEQEFFDIYLRQCPECGYWYKPEDMVDSVCQDCYEEEVESAQDWEDEDNDD